jgi:SAM-dependent methyltransferase
MTPEETARNYDRIAAYWSGPEFNRENGIEAHRRALQFVRNQGSALDVGCGSSGRFIECLVRAGFQVEGVDFSAEMLRLARERHPAVRFHYANVVTWELPKCFDFITAWDSIWHIPLADQEAVLRKLCRGLTDGGVLLFTCGGVDEPGERTNPFQGQPLYHATLGIPRILAILGEEHITCRHLEYDQMPYPHVFLIVQRGGGEQFA